MSAAQSSSQNTTPPIAYAQWLAWPIDETRHRARRCHYADFLERGWHALQRGQVVLTENIDVAAHRRDDLRGLSTIATVIWHDAGTSWYSNSDTGSGLLTIQTLHKAVSGLKRRKCVSVSYYITQVIYIDHEIWYSSGRPFCDENFIWNSFPIFSQPENDAATSAADESALSVVVTID